mmetsp:Transcript_18806/g.42015  ORF Transcript_18806/g.42015 Transcript_18806/m.42015 type:complete len:295 (-) Transcript_18806:241-1125(-)
MEATATRACAEALNSFTAAERTEDTSSDRNSRPVARSTLVHTVFLRMSRSSSCLSATIRLNLWTSLDTRLLSMNNSPLCGDRLHTRTWSWHAADETQVEKHSQQKYEAHPRQRIAQHPSGFGSSTVPHEGHFRLSVSTKQPLLISPFGLPLALRSNSSSNSTYWSCAGPSRVLRTWRVVQGGALQPGKGQDTRYSASLNLPTSLQSESTYPPKHSAHTKCDPRRPHMSPGREGTCSRQMTQLCVGGSPRCRARLVIPAGRCIIGNGDSSTLGRPHYLLVCLICLSSAARYARSV